jgi:hypothetical protein
MWKIINSPIVITVIAIVAIFSYGQFRKNIVSSEIRGVYEELVSIGEDAKDDLERKKLIESFVAEAAKQVSDGFGSFSLGNEDEAKKRAEKNKHYFQVKKQIKVSEPRVVENKQYSNVQKTVLYKITNGSGEHLEKIAHTIELYNDNQLVLLKEEWGQTKLAPGESRAFSYSVQDKDLVFDTVVISMSDISIMDVAK